jgi:E3 SUMO-protein ligase PIAS1
MSNPMRSTRCNHIQCFDAASWFQINEQTPTWTCPICEQALKIEHLFIDECVA